MTVTIVDIAEVAGVSHSTVSRALRGHPRISSQTIERIQQIATDLGYVPNTVARGLKTSRSRVLGVIVRRLADPFFSEVLQGIEDVLQAAGYSLFLAVSHRDPAREKGIVQAMAERRVDGIIVSSSHIEPEQIRQFGRFQVPLVLINNQAIDEPDVHSVYHDDRFGSRAVTDHLLALGHRCLAFLGNSRGGKTDAERTSGFQEARAAAGLPFDPGRVFAAPNGRPEGGAAGMRAILERTTRPTAVACYNDMMAIGAIQALQQAGIRVPEDMSITGFDNIELAPFASPPLTTFHQPKFDLGREAARMMLRVLADEQAGRPADIVRLRGELIVRRSTGPPAART